MTWGHFFFGFSGRTNRAQLWLWVLLNLIFWAVAMAIAFGIVIATGIVEVVFIAYAIVGIVSLISYLAVIVKRLHDRDKAGWWLLVFVFMPGVLVGISMMTVIVDMINSGGDITAMPEMSPGGMILYLIGLAIALWSFVELFCLRGSIGPNKYGPDPLEGA